MRLFLVISQPFLGGLHFLQGICMHPEENWCKGGWHHTIPKLNIFCHKMLLVCQSLVFWEGNWTLNIVWQGNVDCSQCIPYWNCVNGFCNEEPYRLNP